MTAIDPKVDAELTELEHALAEAETAALERDVDVAAGLVPTWARRALFPHERRARTNYVALDAAIQARTAAAVRHVTEQRDRIAAGILAELGTAVTAVDLAAKVRRLIDPTRPLPVPAGSTTALADALEVELAAEWTAGAVEVLAEATAQLGDPPAPAPGPPAGVDAATLRARAETAAMLPGSTVTSSIAGALGRLPILTQPVATSLEVLGDVARTAGQPGLERAAARTPVQQAHAAGRVAEFRRLAPIIAARPRARHTPAAAHLADPETDTETGRTIGDPQPDELVAAAAFYASELLDGNTCPPCSMVDGVEYPSLDEALVDYPAGTYAACDGGDGCRGTIVAVWEGEAAPTVDDVAPVPRPELPAPTPPTQPTPKPRTSGKVPAAERDRLLAELAASSGYDLEALRSAMRQLDDLRAAMSAEARGTQEAAKLWFTGAPSPITGEPGPSIGYKLAKPPPARKVTDIYGRSRWVRPGAGGEWDWLEAVPRDEFRRLQKRGWFDALGQSPDQLHHSLVSAGARIDDGALGIDQAAELWRQHTSLVDAAGSVGRGKAPGAGHLVGLDDIAPNLAAEGWDLEAIIGANPSGFDADAILHVAGKAAADDAAYAERELLDAYRSRLGLGSSSGFQAVEGPAPWTVTTSSYRDELIDLEQRIREATDAGAPAWPADVRRWNELVPIDDVDLNGNPFTATDLHGRIVDLANRAGMDGALPLEELNAVPELGRFDVVRPDPAQVARARADAEAAARREAEARAEAERAKAAEEAARRAAAEADARAKAAEEAKRAEDEAAKRAAAQADAQRRLDELARAKRLERERTATARPPADVVHYDANVPAELRTTIDDLGRIVGAPDDGYPSTVVHWRRGRAGQGKGGHFSPGRRQVPRPKRPPRGGDLAAYRERVLRYNSAEVLPEIQIIEVPGGALDPHAALLHEFGHRIDSLAASTDRWLSSDPTVLSNLAARRTAARLGKTIEEVAANLPELTDAGAAMADFLEAAHRTDAVQTAYGRRVDVPYHRDPNEIWARGFGQWSAETLGGRAAEGEARMLAAAPQMGWTEEEFAELRPLIEQVLRARGLLVE